MEACVETEIIIFEGKAFEMERNEKKLRQRPVVKHSGRITPKQLQEKGGTLPAGKGHWVRKELKTLEVGEMLFVHRTEWKWKGRGNTPSRIANHLNKKTNKEFRTALAADGTGWVIERVK